ncbi:MipA/OmpV family protein [Acidocella sp.]|uniref:MipA/OmpV family protein n=1 Tax=Acidocella sp. TaxID=50710 RepID=UPI003D001A7C
MALRKKISIFCFAVIASMALWKPAFAQTPSPFAEWQYSYGLQLQRLFEPTVPKWQVELGLGSQFAPAAEGLKRYTVQGGPAIDIRYKDIAFLSSGEGLGANLFSFRHISVGGAISYDMGRSPHVDGRDLNGLGTIHPTPELKFFATSVLSKSFPLTIRIDIRKQLGASFGYIGDIGAYMPMPGSSQKFAWFFGPTVTFADGRYMNTYFGISHNQAASSRYPYYKAHGGFKSTGVGLSANYFVTSHVMVDVSAAYSRLLGSAGDSPITQTRDEGTVSLAAIYKF